MIDLQLFEGGLARRASAVVLLAALAALSPAIGFGAGSSELYQATVPAPDRSDAGLSAAFQAALKGVLVRVTGRRNAAAEAVFAPLIGAARRYTQQYRSIAGNQILVAFDGAALERWLLQNGQPVWGNERPLTRIWVGVPNNAGSGDILTQSDGSELKRALDQQASARGISLRWPTSADIARGGVTYAGLMQGPASALADLNKSRGGDGVLLGRAADARRVAGMRWVFLFEGRSAEFSGTLEGVDRAADTYAEAFAASGDVAPVTIEVTGIVNLQSFARVQSYLESLTLISRVSVVSFETDTMRLRLAARGGMESLRRVLAQDSRLQPVSGESAGVPRFRAAN